MIAQHIVYGPRITYDRPRWCSICGCQRETVRGKFAPHQTPQGKPCSNSGQSVKKVNEQSAG